METTNLAPEKNDLRYPVGDFVCPESVSAGERRVLIDQIRDLPANVRAAVDGLTEEQLETPYRPDGWTIRQVVHHVADSHINSICRFKLAMTEENPTIRPYFEDRWAELADYKLPIECSLLILDNLHLRWVAVLESFTDADFERTLVHPDNGQFTVAQFLALYAWHGRHHTAHLVQARGFIKE